MFRFVSSWYDTGSSLSRVNPWICTEESMIFDDTVSAVRMFLSAGRETELICLGYAPQLRSFLQRQDLQEVPYWSAFDELQAVTWTAPGILHWQELDWPAGAACVDCGPYLEILKEEAPFARVMFTREGAIREVDYYEMPAGAEQAAGSSGAGGRGPGTVAPGPAAGGKDAGTPGSAAGAKAGPGRDDRPRILHRDLYDDRGFCSSRIYYEEFCAAQAGKGAQSRMACRPVRQEYYSPLGELRMTQDLTDGSVLAAGDGGQRARRCRSMEVLIRERLRERFWSCPEEDAVVIAANGRHDELVMNALSGQRVVFSFFRDRFDLGRSSTIWYYADTAAMLIADTQTAAEAITGCLTKERRGRLTILTIPPYDARIAFGESEYLPQSGILLPADQLEEPDRGGNEHFHRAFANALSYIAGYMCRHPEVQVLLGTEKPPREQSAFARKLVGILTQRLRKLGENRVNKINQERRDKKKRLEGEAAARESAEHLAEIREPLTGEEADKIRETYSDLGKRFRVVSIRTDEDLIEVMRQVRLLIDLRDRPDTRLQMAAISAGIPQAAFADSFCVEHTRNGFHLENAAAVEEVLPYYLLTLGNWKSAQLCCERRLSAYADGTLVRQWEEGLERYEDAARGAWFQDIYEERGRKWDLEKAGAARFAAKAGDGSADQPECPQEDPAHAADPHRVSRGDVVLDGSAGSMAVLPVSCAGLSAGFRERILAGAGESAVRSGTRNIVLELRPKTDSSVFLPVIEWQSRLAVTGACSLSFWPVYVKSGGVLLRFRLVRQLPDGGTRMDLLSEEDLELPWLYDNVLPGTMIFCLLEAAGSGSLEMGDLRFTGEGVASARALRIARRDLRKSRRKPEDPESRKNQTDPEPSMDQKIQKIRNHLKKPAGTGAAKSAGPPAARTNSAGRIRFPETAQRRRVPQREEILYSFAHKKKGERLLQVFFTGGSQEQIRMAGEMLQRLDVSRALILADPRFEGTGVFLGRQEDDAFEQAVMDLIREYLALCGLGEHDAVFAGLDCGAAAALYYGARLHPAAIVLGRPVLNLGSAALNEKIIRPAEFPVSLDILAALGPEPGPESEEASGAGEGNPAAAARVGESPSGSAQAGTGTSLAAASARVGESADTRRARALNRRLWDRLEQEKAGLADTEILFVGLKEDDYDGTARADLARFCLEAGIRLNVKELPGRHRDNEQELLLWLENRYRDTIRRCCANNRR